MKRIFIDQNLSSKLKRNANAPQLRTASLERKLMSKMEWQLLPRTASRGQWCVAQQYRKYRNLIEQRK
jgi:hypothetical protein